MKNLDIQFANDQAVHACETCKRRKRRCDKGLPRCSACVSKKLHCDYSDPTAPKPQDGNPHPNPHPGELGLGHRIQPHQSQLPSVFFLDHTLFQRSQILIPPPLLPIPPYIASLIGSNTAIRNVASTFFATVHSYLPIISKKTFYDHFLNPFLQQRSDVAFLCLCMKLILWVPSNSDSNLEGSDAQTVDYLAGKQYLSELESAGVFTVPMLQGRVLIALYEFGHGIYPAAYMSIGNCAAQAFALGLGSERDAGEVGVEEGRRLTWVEHEERRRVWWAIVILERVVYLGSVGRPLVTPDPTACERLPSDDISWDQGVMAPNYPINSPVGSSVNMGRMARLSHATYLLSQVIRHTSDESFTDNAAREEQIVQLDRTIRALMVVCEQESLRTNLRYCNPLSICASALLLLHSHYISPSSSSSSSSGRYREASFIAMQELSRHLAIAFKESHHKHSTICLLEISPLVLHSVYRAGVFLVGMNRDAPSAESEKGMRDIKETLEMKDGKWKISGAYLRILEAREIMSSY